MRVGLLIAASFAAPLLTGQTESTNAINVHVANSVTGTPIAGASVFLDNARDDRLYGRTDAGGAFTGRSNSAGEHHLIVTRAGYRMTGGGIGKMVDVKAGSETNITVEMLPLGVLAGRVLDQYGDPVRHASVGTEDKMNVPGDDQDFESYSSAITDDRGEFRISEIEPGEHYLAVEYSSTDDERSSGTRSPYRWPRTGGLVLYPDATDMGQAQQVGVGAGETKRLNDIHLKIERAVTISGRIKPPPVEGTPSLSVARATPLPLHSWPLIQGAGSDTDGSFKVEVLPGTYVLTASDAKTGKISKPLTLEVREKNITGLELVLGSGYDIHGQVAVDGQETIDFSKILLDFGGGPVKIDGSGAFQAHLFGSKGFYVLQGLPEDWYLKEVRVAGKRISSTRFEIDPGNTDVLFTLSARGARIEMTLQGAGLDVEAAIVTLLPDNGPVPDLESILQGTVDESGKVIVLAVPPGAYRAFTLGASNWVLMMRPDQLLEKYRELAPLISVSEGERKSIVIPVVKIPE